LLKQVLERTWAAGYHLFLSKMRNIVHAAPSRNIYFIHHLPYKQNWN